MRVLTFTALLIAGATAAAAQSWDFGVLGGGSLFNNVTATSQSGSATAGFAPGFVAGVYAGENLYRHVSGEIHYEYMQSDLRLSAGGQTAEFAGIAHALHYDVSYYAGGTESRARFFAVLGGGIKMFSGTGTEEAYQPLSQYGYFTKAQTFKPLASAGVGFTYRMSSKLLLRAEVRDFATAFPTMVLTPPTGVRYGSVLQQFVPMIGIVYVK